MNNDRYAMWAGVSGVAGLVSATILIVNAAKRAGLIPTLPATQLLAPVAEVAAIIFVLGLLLWTELRTTSAAVATAVNVAALALLVGVEFLINLVFAEVGAATTAALLGGPAGVAIVTTSVLFLIATALLVVVFWRRVPRPALIAYGLGASVVSLRAFVPEVVLDIALVAMALGIIGLSIPMTAGKRNAAYVAH